MLMRDFCKLVASSFENVIMTNMGPMTSIEIKLNFIFLANTKYNRFNVQ